MARGRRWRSVGGGGAAWCGRDSRRGAQHTRMKRRCASVLRRRPAVAAPLDMPSWPPEPPVGPLAAGLPEDLFFLPLRFPPIALSARYLSRRSLGQVRQLLDRSPPTLPACIVIKERPPGPRSTAPAGVPREERGTAVTIRSVLEQIVRVVTLENILHVLPKVYAYWNNGVLLMKMHARVLLEIDSLAHTDKHMQLVSRPTLDERFLVGSVPPRHAGMSAVRGQYSDAAAAAV